MRGRACLANCQCRGSDHPRPWDFRLTHPSIHHHHHCYYFCNLSIRPSQFIAPEGSNRFSGPLPSSSPALPSHPIPSSSKRLPRPEDQSTNPPSSQFPIAWRTAPSRFPGPDHIRPSLISHQSIFSGRRIGPSCRLPAPISVKGGGGGGRRGNKLHTSYIAYSLTHTLSLCMCVSEPHPGPPSCRSPACLRRK